MDLQIKGKNAFITGGSRGLGYACAIALASEGVNVAFCARGDSDIDYAKEQIQSKGVACYGFKSDLSDLDSAVSVFGKARQNLGTIDILVNNVGGSLGTKAIHNTPSKDFHKVVDLNFWVSVTLMKSAIPYMIEQKWGRVINISSIYGREYGGSAAYMASKSALIAVTKHTAIDLAKSGVTVNSIAPGSILIPRGSWERFVNSKTPEEVEQFIQNNLPMGRFGWAKPVGLACAFLAGKDASYITGVCLNVDGGQSHSLI